MKLINSLISRLLPIITTKTLPLSKSKRKSEDKKKKNNPITKKIFHRYEAYESFVFQGSDVSSRENRQDKIDKIGIF